MPWCFNKPNSVAQYAAKHQKEMAPTLNGGIVIKYNGNQRYTTGSVTGFFVREICRDLEISCQEFAVKNDCPCGSTIGPMLSAQLGIRAVDVGMPQLSMHSIREVMGVSDLETAHRLFTGFLRDWRGLDERLCGEDG